MGTVHLGMATYNAEAFVAEAIECVRNQYYDDWTMTISDNGSTDRTVEIVASIEDPRIGIFLQPKNLGLRGNFRWLFDHAGGADFFAWVSDHDLRRRDWLSKSLEVLEADDALGLAASSCYQAEGTRIVRHIQEDIDTRRCRTPGERFGLTLSTVLWNFGVYGLQRRCASKEVAAFDYCYGYDYLWMAEMALRHPVAFIDEPLLVPVINRPLDSYEKSLERLARNGDVPPSSLRDSLVGLVERLSQLAVRLCPSEAESCAAAIQSFVERVYGATVALQVERPSPLH